ncbi:DivIVA domain-containing protein [Arcanobacterium phocisimile]|uniref:DivIVA domain-containing protein n=1 Tax=Arcanobacterium phocisimile TaxID=1302235 RepID=A0ABX7ILL0_9ACTO|nr:DivIVA domain-containing protein [Arcanobacterium phocisimile]QRV02708.1 DivIVA domain-containing protein [Arcanobacterium phocisimile]
MSDTFSRVGWLHSGYSPADVDSFFARAKDAYDMSGEEANDFSEATVRDVSFPWVRNGYHAQLVDAALDRLEQAFVQRRRANCVRDKGEEEWVRTIYDRATSLYPRLRRPQGQRFAHPDTHGYSVTEVDQLIERVIAFFDKAEPLTSVEVRNTTFSQAKGESAYDEGVVDVFLDRVVSVLMSVE